MFDFNNQIYSPFIAGPLSKRVGRKWVLLSSSVIQIVGIVLIMVASKVWMLIMGRGIQGFASGFVLAAAPIYVGEISSDSVRGTTGSFLNLFIQIGILYVYIIGPYVSYQMLQWCCLAIPIVFAVCFIFMPESPYYLVGKNRQEDAQQSLQFLRGQSAEGVQNEITLIQAAVDEAQANKGSFRDLFGSNGNRKALLITCGLIVFQQTCGINVVLFNAQTIFAHTGTDLDPAIATIIVGLVQVSSSALASFTAYYFGRKLLLLISAGIMTLCLTSLGIFFYMKMYTGDISLILWLPIAALVLDSFAYCIGFGALPMAIVGEIFAPNVKSSAVSIVTSMLFISSFASIYLYPILVGCGIYYVFWGFGLICAMAFVFVKLMVFETRGLSLLDIQDILHAKKN
uniref:Major facilitator superfamily (MFS) profile domain-containing protein n=1 Tax=Stomoxys calcitrans TaxID=35570 RepID=A0A1I8Q9A6_STOCA